MNDLSKPVGEIEKDLLQSRRQPRRRLPPRRPAAEVTPQEVAERSHADFPETIKYLGR